MGSNWQREMEKLTKEALVRDLKNLGIGSGDLLNVKASIRSIGEVEGGADTLIDALLEVVGTNGTVVTDSFVPVYSPFTTSFWKIIIDQNTHSYAGALANAILKRKNVHRSQHPIQKFALIGSLAGKLANGHTADSYAYDILRIMAENDGKNLKIGSDEKVPGVGTTHVAIGLKKIRQKRSFVGVRYRDRTGNKRFFLRNWSGGCMDAFYRLNEIYDGAPGAVLAKGRIGKACAKLTSMELTLKAELDMIDRDIKSFLSCANPNCVECAFSWENLQRPLIPFLFRALARGDVKSALKAVAMKFLYRYPF